MPRPGYDHEGGFNGSGPGEGVVPQPAQAVSLEGGGEYGSVGATEAAMTPPEGLAVPDMTAMPAGVPPMEAATEFPNQVTPLTAPGQGIPRPAGQRPSVVSTEMRAAAMLAEAAEASPYPDVRDAADQMRLYLRNG
tara:strand:+ start:1175 stop:1582 length:408 start_codon:yes stop_codon:yes gene_type:complete